MLKWSKDKFEIAISKKTNKMEQSAAFGTMIFLSKKSNFLVATFAITAHYAIWVQLTSHLN